MVERVSIKRVPIKVISRAPVHRLFCNCFNTKTLVVNGDPIMVYGDEVSNYPDFLESLNVTPSIYLVNRNGYIQRVRDTISRGVGVILSTNEIVPDSILEELGENPFNSLWFRMELVGNSLSNSYKVFGLEKETLFGMFHRAKSYGVSLALEVYMPLHPNNQMDVFEVLEISKNFITDMFVWNVESPLQHTYNRIRSSTLNMTGMYLKGKKISLNILGEPPEYSRTRHITDKPLNLPTTLYSKVDGRFYPTQNPIEVACPTCGKNKFI